MDNETNWNYEARMAARAIQNEEIAKERRVASLVMYGLALIGTVSGSAVIILHSV